MCVEGQVCLVERISHLGDTRPRCTGWLCAFGRGTFDKLSSSVIPVSLQIKSVLMISALEAVCTVTMLSGYRCEVLALER